MKKTKPVVAIVLGILHIFFGSLGVICNLCGGAALIGVYVFFKALYDQAPPQEKKELDDLWQAMSASVPGLMVFVAGEMVISMVMGFVLVIAGIGLLGVKPWARSLSIIWAVGRIVVVAATLVITLAFVNPATQKFNKDMEKWVERMEKRNRPPGSGPPPKSAFSGFGSTGNPAVDIATSLGGAVINIAYAVVVLILMLIPSTGHAFARYNNKEDDFRGDAPGSEDYYDDDYQRQRRELPPLDPPP
jgi:amino acid transporter